MNIELIKWMASKDKDFEIMSVGAKGHLSYKIGAWISFDSIEFKEVYHSFLLNKAIEGLNREMKEQNWINIEVDCVCCYLDHDDEDITFFYKDYTEDEAKEKALELFYGRECELNNSRKV